MSVLQIWKTWILEFYVLIKFENDNQVAIRECQKVGVHKLKVVFPSCYTRRMKILMKFLVLLIPVALVTFLISYLHSYKEGVVNPEGVIALAEKHLMITAFSLMLLVVVPVFVMLFAFVWHFRAGNTKAKYTPDWHENTTLELIWWFIPGVIVIALAIITWKSTHDLDPYKPIDNGTKPLVVQVVALDWKWLFIYPEEGVASVNFVEFPKDRPISLYITSDAPMNGFWIPQLGGQVYAMTGMSSRLHLVGTKNGEYRGASSNFSGDGFSEMKFAARVLDQQDFNEWVSSLKNNGMSLNQSAYEELARPSEKNPVTLYGAVEPKLYDIILMKYMNTTKQGVTSGSDMNMMKM